MRMGIFLRLHRGGMRPSPFRGRHPERRRGFSMIIRPEELRRFLPRRWPRPPHRAYPPARCPDPAHAAARRTGSRLLMSMLPAGQLRGQAGVLALLADGQRQLAVGHRHAGRPSPHRTRYTLTTRAGFRALATNSAGSADHLMISIFSSWPLADHLFHAACRAGQRARPPGSTIRLAGRTRPSWCGLPASRAMDLISTMPSANLGHLHLETGA